MVARFVCVLAEDLISEHVRNAIHQDLQTVNGFKIAWLEVNGSMVAQSQENLQWRDYPDTVPVATLSMQSVHALLDTIPRTALLDVLWITRQDNISVQLFGMLQRLAEWHWSSRAIIVQQSINSIWQRIDTIFSGAVVVEATDGTCPLPCLVSSGVCWRGPFHMSATVPVNWSGHVTLQYVDSSETKFTVHEHSSHLHQIQQLPESLYRHRATFDELRQRFIQQLDWSLLPIGKILRSSLPLAWLDTRTLTIIDNNTNTRLASQTIFTEQNDILLLCQFVPHIRTDFSSWEEYVLQPATCRRANFTQEVDALFHLWVQTVRGTVVLLDVDQSVNAVCVYQLQSRDDVTLMHIPTLWPRFSTKQIDLNIQEAASFLDSLPLFWQKDENHTINTNLAQVQSNQSTVGFDSSPLIPSDQFVSSSNVDHTTSLPWRDVWLFSERLDSKDAVGSSWRSRYQRYQVWHKSKLSKSILPQRDHGVEYSVHQDDAQPTIEVSDENGTRLSSTSWLGFEASKADAAKDRAMATLVAKNKLKLHTAIDRKLKERGWQIPKTTYRLFYKQCKAELELESQTSLLHAARLKQVVNNNIWALTLAQAAQNTGGDDSA